MREAESRLSTPLKASLIAVITATVGFSAAKLALGHLLGVELGSLALTGLALTSFYIGRSISSAISGFIYDRYIRGARLAPGLSLLGVAACLYTMSLTRDPTTLITLSCLQGLLSGLTWPFVQTVVALESKGSATMLSVYFATGSIGISLGKALFPHILYTFGLPSVFRLASLTYALAGLTLAYGYRGVDTRRWYKSKKPREGFVRGSLDVIMFNFSSGFMMGLDSQVLYPLLVNMKHVSVWLTSYGLAAADLIASPAKIAAGRLGDRKGVGIASIAVSTMSLAALAILSLCDGILALTAAIAFLTLASSLVPLARVAAALRGSQLGAPASIVGLSNTMSNIGSLTSPLLIELLLAVPAGLCLYALPAILASVTTYRRMGG